MPEWLTNLAVCLAVAAPVVTVSWYAGRLYERESRRSQRDRMHVPPLHPFDGRRRG